MPQQKLNEMQHRVAVYDAICLQAVILLGSKNMDRLYDNRRKFVSFSVTAPIHWLLNLAILIMVLLRCNFTLTHEQFTRTFKQFTYTRMELLVVCALLPARNSHKIIR